MAQPDIDRINSWVTNAGIKLVTGVHILNTDHAGLGLEYNHAQNVQDEMSFRNRSSDAASADESPAAHSLSADPVFQPSLGQPNSIQTTGEQIAKPLAGQADGNKVNGTKVENGEEDATEFSASEGDSELEDDEFEFDGFEDEDEDEEKILALVPADLILSADTIRRLAKGDRILQQFLEPDTMSDKDILHVGLVYLWLYNPENPWKGYFDYLPKHIELPFTYSIKKMEGLDFSTVSLHHAAITKRLQIEKSYERFVKKRIVGRKLTLQEWLLPHAWISSRGITHPLTGQTCLVPIIDLCNHSCKHANVRYEADEEGNFELRLTVPADTVAAEGTASGDLLLNYGDRSSGEFLFNYGFIPDDRTDDDFDEVFKVFDVNNEEIRAILDLSRAKNNNLSEEERHGLALAYDVLSEFFEEAGPQVLRIIRFPKMVEPEESKRYRFHNNFIMALASNDRLTLREYHGHREGLYFDDKIQLSPTNAFEVVRKLGDEKLLLNARELVAKLCEHFSAEVSTVSNDDPLILRLAGAESSLYKHYSESYQQLNREQKEKTEQNQKNIGK